MDNQTDLDNKRHRPSEITLTVSCENKHDVIMNRYLQIAPDSVAGGAEGLTEHAKQLKIITSQFIQDSQALCKLLHRKGDISGFKTSYEIRRDLRTEVNQYIDLLNIELSSYNVEIISNIDLASMKSTADAGSVFEHGSNINTDHLQPDSNGIDNLNIQKDDSSSKTIYNDTFTSPQKARSLPDVFPKEEKVTFDPWKEVEDLNGRLGPHATTTDLGRPQQTMTTTAMPNNCGPFSTIHSGPVFSQPTNNNHIHTVQTANKPAPLSASAPVFNPNSNLASTRFLIPAQRPNNIPHVPPPGFAMQAPPGSAGQIPRTNPLNYASNPLPGQGIPIQSLANNISQPIVNSNNPPFQLSQGGVDPSMVMMKHYVMSDLTKDSIRVFDGKSYMFWSWIDQINAKVGTFQMSPAEILFIMRSKSSGGVQELIDNYLATPGGVTQEVFQVLWSQLAERYGNHTTIYEEIMDSLENFPTITGKNTGPQIQKLHDLCVLAHANIARCEDLDILNRGPGLKKIRARLSVPLQEAWQKVGQPYLDRYKTHPPFSEFINFLKSQYRRKMNPSFEIIAAVKPESNKKSVFATNTVSKPENDSNKSSPSSTGVTYSKGCPIHKGGGHRLAQCNEFKSATVPQRMEILKKHRRCFKCTGAHYAANCVVKVWCSTCKGSHHSLLHRDVQRAPKETSRSTPTSSAGEAVSPEVQSYCTAVCNDLSPVNCSKTLLVDICHKDNPSVRVRAYAILDEHSNTTLIDDKLVGLLDLDAEPYSYSLSTVNGFEHNVVGKLVKGLEVKGVNNENWIEINEAVTNNSIPCTKKEVATRSMVRGNPKLLGFADKFENLDRHAEVLMLIGRNCQDAMGTVCHTREAPWVHQTPLGWAIVGSACPQVSAGNKHCKKVLRTQVITHDHINIVKPSNLCSPPQFDPFIECSDDEELSLSVDDQKFCDIMTEAVKLNDSGSVEAPLPLKNDEPLPFNKYAVFFRSKNMLDRLQSKPKELAGCLTSMEDSLKSGFVEQIPFSERDSFREGRVWWLPIFPVWNPHKDKPRLVHDAAASYHGVCLNDRLLAGPDSNHELRGLLQNVREQRVALMADIEAMFSNYKVSPSDRDLLRFFWWENNDPSKEIVEYRSTSHVFGCKSSPGVASWCLLYSTTLPEAAKFPLGRDFIKSNCYVDDLIGSVSSVEQGIECVNQAKDILSNVNVRLHKVMSNEPAVLEAFPENDRAKGSVALLSGEHEGHKTLGLMWDPIKDTFSISVQPNDGKFTRRNVLATINSVYDPLGMVSPVTLGGRLIQRLVLPKKENMTKELASCGWDTLLPEKYLPLWENWKKSLQYLGQIEIPRCLIPKHFSDPVRELRCFCDASDKALGYVVFMRSIQNNEVNVSFVLANSKVAPQAAVTIPRLELNAAVELVLRVSKLVKDLKCKPDKVVFYSDSKIVLGYINNEEKRFTKYVARRVAIIRKLSIPSQWEYVKTQENCADWASRASKPAQLLDSCWINGPKFLWEPDVISNSTEPLSSPLPEMLEELNVLQTVCIPNTSQSFISKYANEKNSWLKIVGTVKCMLTCLARLDQARQRLGISLAARPVLVEHVNVEKFVVKLVQNQVYPEVFNQLASGKCLQENHKLANLAPFLDQEQILRVGGRIKNSMVPFDVKHPMLIPPMHPVTNVLVQYYHDQNGHQGRELSHANIRMNGFHIVNGKSVIRKIVSQCNMCKRLRGALMSQQMSDLPKDRLEQVPPFCNSGLDVFGPIYISEKRATRKTSGQRKIWVLLFVCLVSRAVHVEIMPAMDTSSFRNAFQRFVAIRGRPKLLRSDNGSNFVAAHSQMSNGDISSLENHFKRQDIKWMFNPPYAHHFGGVYETRISQIRRALEGTMATQLKSRLSYDEFHTLLLEACNIVNHSPLTEISDDPHDPTPITPASLLLLRESTDTPSFEDFSEKDLLQYGKLRHRRVQWLAQEFWRRWVKEYVTSLHRRHKWKTRQPCVSVDDVVLVKNEQKKRHDWSLARVLECKKSSDGLVRSVSLKFPPLPGSSKPRISRRCIHDLVLLVPSDSHPQSCFAAATDAAGGGRVPA